MYRAALIIKKAGYPYMQVVKANLSMTVGLTVHNQNATFELIGVRTPDAPLTCEIKAATLNSARPSRRKTKCG